MSLAAPMIAGLGAQELILIILVLLLLFGATKLPDLARGTGRALKIFKDETKGLRDADSDEAADDQASRRSQEQQSPPPKPMRPIEPVDRSNPVPPEQGQRQSGSTGSSEQLPPTHTER